MKTPRKTCVRTIAILLSLLMLTATLFTAPVSADPAPSTNATLVWDFSSARKYEIVGNGMFAGEAGACTVAWEENDAKFTATAANANWLFMVMNVNLDTTKTKYVKFRIKNQTEGTAFELWTGRTTRDNFESHIYLKSVTTLDADWKEYVFDISAATFASGSWTGNIRQVRLDLVANPSNGKATNTSTTENNVVYLDYFAFFDSLDDANAFSIRDWETENPALLYPRRCAGNTSPSWIVDFSAANETAIKAQMPANNTYLNANYEWLDEGLKITSTKEGANPTFGYTLPVASSGAACRYAKIRVKNEGTLAGTTIWVASNEGASNTQMQKSLIFPITAGDTEFKEYIIAFGDAQSSGTNPWLNGRLGTVRFDPLCAYDADASNKREFSHLGDSITIDYFAMFATLAEAQAFDIHAYRNPVACYGVQASEVTDGTYSLRFVGTYSTAKLPLAQADEIGFAITATFENGGAQSKSVTRRTTTVFESLNQNAGDGLKEVTAVSLGADYLYALTVTDIPADTPITFTVTAQATFDSVTVSKAPVSFTVTYTDGNLVITPAGAVID